MLIYTQERNAIIDSRRTSIISEKDDNNETQYYIVELVPSDCPIILGKYRTHQRCKDIIREIVDVYKLGADTKIINGKTTQYSERIVEMPLV